MMNFHFKCLIKCYIPFLFLLILFLCPISSPSLQNHHFLSLDYESETNLASTTSPHLETACEMELQNMMDYYYYSNFTKLLYYSGDDINTLGHQAICSTSGENRFATLTIQPEDLVTTYRLGICLPNECQESDYKIMGEQLGKYLSALYIDPYVNYSAELISMYYVKIHNYDSKWAAGAFLIGVGIILFVIAFLGACIFYDKNKEHSESSAYADEFNNHFYSLHDRITEMHSSELVGLLKRRSQYKTVEDSAGLDGLEEERICPSYEKMLFCFAMNINFHQIFLERTQMFEDQFLRCFNGLRTIGFLWAISFYTIFLLIMTIASNSYELSNIFSKFPEDLLISGSLSSNMFFFMSGFLAFHKISQKYQILNIKIILKIYASRLFRLVPLFYIVLAYSSLVCPFISSGPIFYSFENIFTNCINCWYGELLLIGNYFPIHNLFSSDCMFWNFQLFLDIQFFLFVPLFIYIYRKNVQACIMSLVVVILICIAITVGISYWKNFEINPLDFQIQQIFRWLCQMPYYKFPSYGIGILFAIVFINFTEYKTQIREKQSANLQNEDSIFNTNTSKVSSLPKEDPLLQSSFRKLQIYSIWTSLFFYILGLIGLAASIILPFLNKQYATESSNTQDIISAIIFGLDDTLFVLGLMCILIPVLLDEKSILRKILSLKLLTPFSNLTYSGYLISPTIILIMYTSISFSIYVNLSSITFLFLGNLVLSLAGSLLCTLFIEYPIRNVKAVFIDKTVFL